MRHAGIWKETFQECSRREGAGLATRVETLGVDLRTRTKQLGAKENAKKKWREEVVEEGVTVGRASRTQKG